MKRFGLLILGLLAAIDASANLRKIPVSESTQKELGLVFDLSFKHLTDDLLQVRLIAKKEGELKDLMWPSVFIGETRKLTIDVPLSREPVLTNQYSFLIHPYQVGKTRLHLHCMTGGSSEVLYDIDLRSYAIKQGFATFEPYSYNLLPLLKDPAKSDLQRVQLDSLTTAKVTSESAAEEAALKVQIEENGGLDARDSFRVEALFALSHGVEGFATHGDLIWNVKVVRQFPVEVSNEIWINARTGAGKSMLKKP